MHYIYLIVNYFNSIRRRALDLLYGMCDVSNAKDIVEEILQVLTNLCICNSLDNSFIFLAKVNKENNTWLAHLVSVSQLSRLRDAGRVGT